MAVKVPQTVSDDIRLSVALQFPKEDVLTNEQLLKLSSLNRDLRLERSHQGDLIVMTPTGGLSSQRNAEIIFQLKLWAKDDGTGKVFDSSGGFSLANGAVRAPDAAWVRNETLMKLSQEEPEGYPPLCPTFVIELRSATDRLSELKEKMQEYVDNGALLGWLIDPTERAVYVYFGDGIKVLDNPEKVSGEPLLKGFELDMLEVF